MECAGLKKTTVMRPDNNVAGATSAAANTAWSVQYASKRALTNSNTMAAQGRVSACLRAT